MNTTSEVRLVPMTREQLEHVVNGHGGRTWLMEHWDAAPSDPVEVIRKAIRYTVVPSDMAAAVGARAVLVALGMPTPSGDAS